MWHDFMTEAMKGIPPTEFTEPAPIESLADKAKREERGGFDLGGRSDAPGIPGATNYYPSAPLPWVSEPTTTTTAPPEESTTTTVPPESTTTTSPPASSSTTTTTFGFRRPSSTTTSTTSRGPFG
jgi:hypothetical protein